MTLLRLGLGDSGMTADPLGVDERVARLGVAFARPDKGKDGVEVDHGRWNHVVLAAGDEAAFAPKTYEMGGHVEPLS